MRRFGFRLSNLFRGSAADREMTREIDAHLALLQEDFERRGLSPREAALAARRAYGGVEQAKELHREARTFLWIDQFFKDVRYALRNLRRSPGFTLTAVAVLALGMGATSAIFSVVNAALLKPLPVEDLDRIVMLMTADQSGDGESSSSSTSAAKFVHFQQQSSILEDVTAFLIGAANYTSGDTAEVWSHGEVSGHGFALCGVRIVHGRTFSAEEERPSGPLVAILGESVWKRSFAGDPQVLGRTILLDGEPHTVVGIVADNSGLLVLSSAAIDVYTPYRVDPNTMDVGNFTNFLAIARLKPGVSAEQASERLRVSTDAYRLKYHELDEKEKFIAKPFRRAFFEDVQGLILMLAGAVSLVLLIACANVANLLLARATTRRREMGIRVAVGAGRGRVIRQLLTESVMLGTLGGVLGLLAGSAGIRALMATMEDTDLPSLTMVAMDWRVVGFAFAVSLFTGIAFGLLPAIQASRVDLNTVLKSAGGEWTTGFRKSFFWKGGARAALVISEVSLAVILLVGSALLIRTFVELYRVERGFETKNVIALHTMLRGEKFKYTANVAAAVRDGLREIRAIPGVLAAASTCCPPLLGNLNFPFDVIGRQPVNGQHSGGGGWMPVAGDYFEALQIPVKRGRVFTPADLRGSAPVVVISERMAKEFWKDSDPLNDRILIGKGVGPDYEDNVPRQIIGIVGDVRQETLSAEPSPQMYVPASQLPDAVTARIFQLTGMGWIIQTRNQQPELFSAIREAVRKATGLPVADIATMDQIVSGSTTGERFSMMLMTVFGGSALLLAVVGIYGLMAYTVQQRTVEIGIRLALGAEARQVKFMLLRQGMTLALPGLAIGLAGAWALSRVMESFLFGVKPQDPLVFVSVPVVLSLAALLAVWAPARRVLKVDPVEALRCE
jgi:putative ABC transport system permease protein